MRSTGLGPLMYLAGMLDHAFPVPAGEAIPPAALLFAVCWAAIAPAMAGTGDTAISVYAGRMTDEDWIKSLSGRADWVDARLVALAGARTLWRDAPRHWSFEVEGNAVRHFGLQDHWEFNALGTMRFHAFPWRERLATSVAFGAGPSYATRVPAAEVRLDGRSRRSMLYWQLELELAQPGSDWATLFRLHHRSTAYGAFGKQGGGNVLTAGLRYRY